MRQLRIHGDNVVECERALDLVSRALNIEFEIDKNSSIISPCLRAENGKWEIQLLPGHGRWGIDIADLLRQRGSTLRENADAVISEVLPAGDERILAAVEFCGALPAGNNAWQRHGRALGFGQAGIPYLIYNEIGGLELDQDRQPKASRLPNPAVPYSLVQYSDDTGCVVLPIYEAAPSAPNEMKAGFAQCVGTSDAYTYFAELLGGEVSPDTVRALRRRALTLVHELTNSRKRGDGLTFEQWCEVLESGGDRVGKFIELNSRWRPSRSEKVKATTSAREFISGLVSFGPVALGSGSLPFLVIPQSSLEQFGDFVEGQYGSEGRRLASWITQEDKPLVVVLVTGFKPRGDDSRPDRGLAPLARMLAGPRARLLSFLWGPGNSDLLNLFRENPSAAAKSNGLIEAVSSCSDYVLVDSITAEVFLVDTSSFMHTPNHERVELGGQVLTPLPGEHDVDSAFHFLVTRPPRPWVFEGMCNPPGGDWSGISISLDSGEEVRWTSLPRVSSSGAKRPDHVVQVSEGDFDYIFSVESKNISSRMEAGVGPMLTRYTDDLFAHTPTIQRNLGLEGWTDVTISLSNWKYRNISVGLFVYRSAEDLRTVLDFSTLDIVGAFEFEGSGPTVLHLFSDRKANEARRVFKKMVKTSSFSIEVREY
jgi:hypothetical protein